MQFSFTLTTFASVRFDSVAKKFSLMYGFYDLVAMDREMQQVCVFQIKGDLVAGPPTVIMVNMNVRSMGPFSEIEEVSSISIKTCS